MSAPQQHPHTEIRIAERTRWRQALTTSVGAVLAIAIPCGLVATGGSSATALDSMRAGAHEELAQLEPSRVDGETPLGTTWSRDLALYSAGELEWTRATFTMTRVEDGITYRLKIYDMQTYGFSWLTPMKFIPYVMLFTGSPMWSWKKNGVELTLEAKFSLYRNGTEVDYRHPTVHADGTTITLEGTLPTERNPGSYEVGVNGRLVPNTSAPDRFITIDTRLGIVTVP